MLFFNNVDVLYVVLKTEEVQLSVDNDYYVSINLFRATNCDVNQISVLTPCSTQRQSAPAHVNKHISYILFIYEILFDNRGYLKLCCFQGRSVINIVK